MSKGIYIGVNNVATKVKKMYVGVNGVAREVKKVYIGVNGVAKQCFPAVRYTDFSSSIAPTDWSGTATAASTEYTTSNTYGTWKVKMDKAAYSSTYVCWKAFDSNTSTYLRASSAANNWVQIYMPTNIAIKPTQITCRATYLASGSIIEGKNAETGSWETLYTTDTAISGTVTNITANITTNNYYSAFAINAHKKSNTSRIYDFKINSGTVRDMR